MPYRASSGRICTVVGCRNSQRALYKWRETLCDIHPDFIHKDCPCLEPFKFHTFPSNAEMRRLWISKLNKKDFVPAKKSVVCSIHFIDGRPSEKNPVPQLEMGYQSEVSRIQFNIENKMSEDETKKYPLKPTTACCALDCKNNRNLGLSFFRFPKDKERCTKWLINSQRLDLLDRSADYLYKSGGRLCAVHFEDSQFYTPDRNKLKPDSVPTLFGEACLPYQNAVEARPTRELRIKKKVDNTVEEIPQRQLRSLSEDHGKFMENWNPETSNREARKMNRKIYSDSHRALHHHDDKGIHVRSGKDLCDCLDEECPGCHYPCPKCKSPKCGHECRSNRRWIYEKIEIEGTDIVIKTPLKLN